jgi:hypothetical protein
MQVGKWYAEIVDEQEDGSPVYGGILQCIEAGPDYLGNMMYTLSEDDGETCQYITPPNATAKYWTEQA